MEQANDRHRDPLDAAAADDAPTTVIGTQASVANDPADVSATAASAGEASAEEHATEEPGPDEPAGQEPTANKAAVEEPAAPDGTTDTDKAAADPSDGEPAGDAVTVESAADDTAAEEQAGDEQVGDEQVPGGPAPEEASTRGEVDQGPTGVDPSEVDPSRIDPPEADPSAPTTVLPVLPTAGAVGHSDAARSAGTRAPVREPIRSSDSDAVTERVPVQNAPSTVIPPAVAPTDKGRPVGPQRIEPAEPRKRRALVPVIAVVVVLLAAALGYWLFTALGANSTDNRIRDAVTTYVDSLQDGDLAAVRSATCGDLAQFYAGLDDADFAAVRDAGDQEGSIPRIDSIDAIRLDTEDSAIVAVTVSTPQESTGTTRTFDLRREDDQWKVCG